MIDVMARARESTTLVELLVWTYQRQRADVMSGKGLHGMEAAADGDDGGAFSRGSSNAATIEHNCTMGMIITSTAWRQRPALHPDAELVHDLVVSMSERDWIGAMLLRTQAQMGMPPDWESNLPQPHPVMRVVNGQPSRVVGDDGLYSPIVWEPDIGWFEMKCGEYRAWFAALSDLNTALASHALGRWRVMGLGADQEPWRKV